jgi:hypothetical protein
MTEKLVRDINDRLVELQDIEETANQEKEAVARLRAAQGEFENTIKMLKRKLDEEKLKARELEEELPAAQPLMDDFVPKADLERVAQELASLKLEKGKMIAPEVHKSLMDELEQLRAQVIPKTPQLRSHRSQENISISRRSSVDPSIIPTVSQLGSVSASPSSNRRASNASLVNFGPPLSLSRKTSNASLGGSDPSSLKQSNFSRPPSKAFSPPAPDLRPHSSFGSLASMISTPAIERQTSFQDLGFGSPELEGTLSRPLVSGIPSPAGPSQSSQFGHPLSRSSSIDRQSDTPLGHGHPASADPSPSRSYGTARESNVSDAQPSLSSPCGATSGQGVTNIPMHPAIIQNFPGGAPSPVVSLNIPAGQVNLQNPIGAPRPGPLQYHFLISGSLETGQLTLNVPPELSIKMGAQISDWNSRLEKGPWNTACNVANETYRSLHSISFSV